jgi:hypothetical protein
MSRPIAEILSRFTPDGSTLDRDALLFAAGRASARPNRALGVLAACLALSQAVTLAALGYRPAGPVESPPSREAVVPAAPDVPVTSPPPADGPLAVWPQAGVGPDGLPRLSAAGDLVPDAPPLTALSAADVKSF